MPCANHNIQITVSARFFVIFHMFCNKPDVICKRVFRALNKMYLRLESLVLYFYQLFGICSFTQPRNQRLEKFLKCWSLFHLFALLTNIVLCFIFFRSFIYAGDTFGTFTSIVQVSFPIFNHLIVKVESLFKRQVCYKFFDNRTKINFFLANINCNHEAFIRKALIKYIWKVSLVYVPCTVIETFIMVRLAYAETSRNWWVTWELTIFTYLTCRSALLFHMYFMDILSVYVQLLCTQIKSINIRNILFVGDCADSQISHQQYLYEKIKILRKIYSLLCECRNCLNSAFGCSIFLIITNYMICTSINIYWNYASLHFGNNPRTLESLLATSVPITVLLMMFYSAEQLRRNVSIINLTVGALGSIRMKQIVPYSNGLDKICCKNSL